MVLKDGMQMPNRLLKEGICTSDAINMLSSDCEVLFYRLLVVADDFGRMDGRVQIVKSQCFPLKDYFTVEKIKDLLGELAEADLIKFYSVDNKPLFFIKKWDQRVRSKGKYPKPPDEQKEAVANNQKAGDSNVQTDDGLGLGLGKGLGKGKEETHASRNIPPPADPTPAASVCLEIKKIGVHPASAYFRVQPTRTYLVSCSASIFSLKNSISLKP